MTASRCLIAPTGSRKSTEMRRRAVDYVIEHPEETVVIRAARQARR